MKNVLQEEMEILIKFSGQVQLLLYDTIYFLYTILCKQLREKNEVNIEFAVELKDYDKIGNSSGNE